MYVAVRDSIQTVKLRRVHIGLYRRGSCLHSSRLIPVAIESYDPLLKMGADCKLDDVNAHLQ